MGSYMNWRVPFDQNFREFRFKIEWNRTFPENRFENFFLPLEVVLFSGNLEIPEISCSIWHFYPVWICPSSFSREKLKMAASLSSGHYTGCKIICHNSSLSVLDCLFSMLRSDFLANCGLVVPNFLRFISLCLHTSRAYFPTRKVRKCLSLKPFLARG